MNNHSPLAQDLSRIISRQLVATGMTQKELASRAGMTEARISQITTGEINVTFRTVDRVLKGLGLRGRLVTEDDCAPDTKSSQPDQTT